MLAPSTSNSSRVHFVDASQVFSLGNYNQAIVRVSGNAQRANKVAMPEPPAEHRKRGRTTWQRWKNFRLRSTRSRCDSSRLSGRSLASATGRSRLVQRAQFQRRQTPSSFANSRDLPTQAAPSTRGRYGWMQTDSTRSLVPTDYLVSARSWALGRSPR